MSIPIDTELRDDEDCISSEVVDGDADIVLATSDANRNRCDGGSKGASSRG